jgi:hypothetical protein
MLRLTLEIFGITCAQYPGFAVLKGLLGPVYSAQGKTNPRYP